MTNYDKEIVEKVSRVTLADDLKERSRNVKCYYNGCGSKPIYSHSIQETLLKTTIGKSGYVYMQTIQSIAENIRNDSEVMFSKVPTTRSGVFEGFCGDINGLSHDSNLFKSIEIEEEVQKTTIEDYIFKYAYRALVYQIWLVSTLASPMSDRGVAKAKKNPVVDERVLQSFLSLTSSNLGLVDNLQRLYDLKTKIEKYIKTDGEISGNIFETFNLKFVELNDWKLEFAGIGAKIFPNSKYPICYGLVPSQYNKPDLFFWVSSKEDILDDNFLDELLYVNKTYSIQNLVALSGNIMLSEELYQSLKSSENEELDKLKEFISPIPNNKRYDQYDLIRDNGFRLFRTLID
ncbi:TPA: hypothetical protein ACJTO6_001747 [Streptococcus pyogenes]|nr:hypothetical protein [Streptococcus pyogenes]HES5727777.1 hypothetical protein [Streptococcus pyogenes]